MVPAGWKCAQHRRPPGNLGRDPLFTRTCDFSRRLRASHRGGPNSYPVSASRVAIEDVCLLARLGSNSSSSTPLGPRTCLGGQGWGPHFFRDPASAGRAQVHVDPARGERYSSALVFPVHRGPRSCLGRQGALISPGGGENRDQGPAWEHCTGAVRLANGLAPTIRDTSRRPWTQLVRVSSVVGHLESVLDRAPAVSPLVGGAATPFKRRTGAGPLRGGAMDTAQSVTSSS